MKLLLEQDKKKFYSEKIDVKLLPHLHQRKKIMKMQMLEYKKVVITMVKYHCIYRSVKLKWQRMQQERRAEENKKAPAGMSLMPEEERLDTLKILKDNLAATKDHLQRMPLLVETPSAIEKKQI